MTKDRVVIVTGAASGIGLGIARRFAENGHPVALLDLQSDLLETEVGNLRNAGASVIGLVVDISDRKQVDDAYRTVRDTFGSISIVIANAGYSEPRAFSSMTSDQWQRMIDVNLGGTFHTVHAAVPDMIERGWGRVVTISSQAAQSGAPNRAHYAAAKGGVIGLTKALGMELAPLGITVNTIPPSLVATPMMDREIELGNFPAVEFILPTIPAGRAGSADDIADACEFLCSDKASYITGQQINVNGGSYM